MRRTQLYLDDQLWKALHTRARTEGTTVSELVRQTVRKRFLGDLDERRKAMLAFVGSRQESSKAPGATAYIRRLRRGSRLDRLAKP